MLVCGKGMETGTTAAGTGRERERVAGTGGNGTNKLFLCKTLSVVQS